MNTQKGFSTLLGLLLVLSIVGAGGYIYVNNSTVVNENITENTVDLEADDNKSTEAEPKSALSIPSVPTPTKEVQEQIVDPVMSLSKVSQDKIDNCHSLETTYHGDEIERCIVELAISENNEEYCKILEGKYGWDSINLEAGCYSDLAFVNGDYGYCENITGKYSDSIKKDCYTSVAFQTNNPNVCTFSNDSDFCYTWMTNISSDGNLCNFIKNTESKDECQRRHKEDYFGDPYGNFCEQMLSVTSEKMCNQTLDKIKGIR